MTKKQRRKEPAKSGPEARGGGNLTASERTVLKKLAQAAEPREIFADTIWDPFLSFF